MVDRDEAEEMMYSMRYFNGLTDEEIDHDQIELALEQMYDTVDPLCYGDWYSEAISSAFENEEGEVDVEGMQGLFLMFYGISVGEKAAKGIVMQFDDNTSGGLDKEEQMAFWRSMFGIKDEDCSKISA